MFLLWNYFRLLVCIIICIYYYNYKIQIIFDFSIKILNIFMYENFRISVWIFFCLFSSKKKKTIYNLKYILFYNFSVKLYLVFNFILRLSIRSTVILKITKITFLKYSCINILLVLKNQSLALFNSFVKILIFILFY